ncbi:MAG TPA: glutamate formimidoyltransferase [Anaerolineales bacterium]|nr:glutamate formimidoyltransferase [Anaerolineales bacterium]
MKQIVECIPNFSEGRRLEVVEQIVDAARSAGVSILDISSDSDHNRSVLTFAGDASSVEEAAYCSIKKAAELIDLDQHSGEHPRIGATDVVPFVPISGITLEECVKIAERLGKRVSEDLNIPVYLYEAAAKRPDRVNLENIRKGQYEGLKTAIGTDPARTPDFGPAVLGKAGATVVGARTPLVAFNVYLTTDDVTIAKNIAKTIRHSNGGFRYVKAAGFLVEGKAQVSMNLTDYSKTSIPLVVETIRREAARFGEGISSSELVGLIPQDALIDSAIWYTQLDKFEKSQILESRLAIANQEKPQDDYAFISQLAAATPAPGGGSAAAFGGAMSAGLVSMVAGLSIGKKKYADVEEQMKSTLEKAENLMDSLKGLVVEDAAAFAKVLEAFKLKKDTPEELSVRTKAIDEATLYAAEIPLRSARYSLEVMELAAFVMLNGNINAISDGASAVNLAYAAVCSAVTNVKINVASLNEKRLGSTLLSDAIAIEDQARKLIEAMPLVLQNRAGI